MSSPVYVTGHIKDRMPKSRACVWWYVSSYVHSSVMFAELNVCFPLKIALDTDRT